MGLQNRFMSRDIKLANQAKKVSPPNRFGCTANIFGSARCSEIFTDIFGSGRGSETSLGQRGGQRYLGFRDIFGLARGSETTLGQRGVQRPPWVSEGFRDHLGSARGSETTLGSVRGSETTLGQ